MVAVAVGMAAVMAAVMAAAMAVVLGVLAVVMVPEDAAAMVTGKASRLYRCLDIRNRNRKKVLHTPGCCEGRTTIRMGRCQQRQSLKC